MNKTYKCICTSRENSRFTQLKVYEYRLGEMQKLSSHSRKTVRLYLVKNDTNGTSVFTKHYFHAMFKSLNKRHVNVTSKQEVKKHAAKTLDHNGMHSYSQTNRAGL